MLVRVAASITWGQRSLGGPASPAAPGPWGGEEAWAKVNADSSGFGANKRLQPHKHVGRRGAAKPSYRTWPGRGLEPGGSGEKQMGDLVRERNGVRGGGALKPPLA